VCETIPLQDLGDVLIELVKKVGGLFGCLELVEALGHEADCVDVDARGFPVRACLYVVARVEQHLHGVLQLLVEVLPRQL